MKIKIWAKLKNLKTVNADWCGHTQKTQAKSPFWCPFGKVTSRLVFSYLSYYGKTPLFSYIFVGACPVW